MTFLLAQTLIREAQQQEAQRRDAERLPQGGARAAPRAGEQRERVHRPRPPAEDRADGQSRSRRPIEKLTRFEDCYVRSQYEADAAGRRKRTEEARKARIANILTSLGKALATPEAKKMRNRLELNTARSMYTYWALTTGKPTEAINVGEQFARDDPRSSQAEMSAVYALQALQPARRPEAQQVRGRRPGLPRGACSAWRATWRTAGPTTLAGDLARHSIGLQLLREENFGEAIKKLSLIAADLRQLHARLLPDRRRLRQGREGRPRADHRRPARATTRSARSRR